MSATKDQTPLLHQNEIVKLAWKIWEEDGCRHAMGREYLRRAEMRLQEASRQADLKNGEQSCETMSAQ